MWKSFNGMHVSRTCIGPWQVACVSHACRPPIYLMSTQKLAWKQAKSSNSGLMCTAHVSHAWNTSHINVTWPCWCLWRVNAPSRAARACKTFEQKDERTQRRAVMTLLTETRNNTASQFDRRFTLFGRYIHMTVSYASLCTTFNIKIRPGAYIQDRNDHKGVTCRVATYYLIQHLPLI